MQADPFAPLKTSLPNLQPSDTALPNLWDSRFQDLLNNDAVLNRRVADLEKGAKPSRNIQSVSSLNALRAFDQPGSGEIVYVPDYGLYRYYPAATDAEDLPWTVRPDSGVGRWKIDMVPRRMLAAPLGVATLDKQGFVVQSLPNYSITGDKLAPGAVTMTALEDLTLNDLTVLSVNRASLTQLLGALGNRLKAVTGESTWRSDPKVNLGTLNQYAARLDRAQVWAQKQTMTTLEVTGDFILPVR